MSLGQWLRKFREEEMSAFQGVIEALKAIKDEPEAEIENLGRRILGDAPLAARVLRVASSSLYNPSNRPATTIPRTLRLLGAETTRSIWLWLSLAQFLSRGRRQETVQSGLGRSLHAAMQARALAQEIEPSASEDVFAAAFLHHLGDQVFWCYAGEEGAALETLVVPGANDVLAEKTVLGFSLEQLTMALVEEWKLSPLLGEILRGSTGSSVEACVRHGWEVANLAKRGWPAGSLQQCVAKGALRHGLEPTERGARIQEVARATREVVLAMGWTACAEGVGGPETPVGQEGWIARRVAEDFELREEALPGGEGREDRRSSHLFLLETYRELSELAAQGRVTPMFHTVLKAVRNQVGFGRVVFAAQVPGTDLVQGKTAQGLTAPLRPEVFHFTIRRQMADSLSRSMEQGQPVIHFAEEGKAAPVLPDTLRAFVQGSFVFAPARLGHRTVGAFYGDTWTIDRPLTEEMAESFLRLIQQLDLLLAKVSAVRAAANSS